MAYNAQDKQDLLFIYDLPKENYTSVKLSEVFKNKVGFALEKIPQVKRDTTRPHYSCIVKIEDPERFRKACDAMRYFEIDGKQCRALPFDKDLLGMNKQNLVDHNVFVKRIPKEMTMAELHDVVSKVGDVKSLKISLNEDHSSRTYGFICFQDKDSASKAVNDGVGKDGEIELLKYEPKERRDNRKAFNNIYVKNFPETWTEDQVKELFTPYGKIHSCVFQKNDKGAFAFVCFGHEEGQDPSVGASAASQAVTALHGRDMGTDLKLYCREALKKADREMEKTREMLRYKNSKKRCNLYIKNFDPSITEEELIEKFKDFGEIEKVKMFKDDKQKNVYAFVCYRTPDAATNAKNALNRTTFGDRQLYINHYEIKELRKVQNETMEDNADFQKYLNKNSGGSQITETINTQHLYTILTSLLANPRLSNSLFHQGGAKPGQQFRQGGMGPNQRPGNRFPMPQAGNMPNPMQMIQQQQFLQQQQQPMQSQSMHPQQMMNMMHGQQQQQMPQGHYNMAQQPQAAQPLTPQQMQMKQPAAPMDETARSYLAQSMRLVPSIVPENTKYKDQVGTLIFDYVSKIVGAGKAAKITGMLIDLSKEQIVAYLQDYNFLKKLSTDAENLLNQNEGTGQQ